MKKYEESISNDSIWITATPTPLARTLPFYITETGHFIADFDYKTKRDTHDSFLLLYTVSGQGNGRTGNTFFTLTPGHAVIIDCHISHEYYSHTDKWEFLWMHFNGAGVQPLFGIMYPDNSVHPVRVNRFHEFEYALAGIIDKTSENGVADCIDVSLKVHSLFNALCISAFENENTGKNPEPSGDIQAVVDFIKNNYSSSVTIDDMISGIHVSKYHFIRRFRRIMGITPYSYLTNYRINVSKTLLRTTDKTVSDIAEACGFLDTSNFITQFKKHTGQKPLQYRHDFS